MLTNNIGDFDEIVSEDDEFIDFFDMLVSKYGKYISKMNFGETKDATVDEIIFKDNLTPSLKEKIELLASDFYEGSWEDTWENNKYIVVSKG